MREERTLTYAKAYYKRNKYKYEPGDNYESAALSYYLRKEERESLKEYAIKLQPAARHEIERRHAWLEENI